MWVFWNSVFCIPTQSHLTLWLLNLEDAWLGDASLAKLGHVKRKSVISADLPQRYVLIKLIVPSAMQTVTVTAPHNGAGLLPSFMRCAGFLKCSHFSLFFKCTHTLTHTHTHTVYSLPTTSTWIQLHYLILIPTLWWRGYFLHWADEETEAQSCLVTCQRVNCPRPLNFLVKEPSSKSSVPSRMPQCLSKITLHDVLKIKTHIFIFYIPQYIQLMC